MGTDYKLGCNECEKVIDTFSRKAWGISFMPEDVVEALKFLVKHTVECGAEKVTVFMEQTPPYEDWEHEHSREREDYLQDYNNIPKWVAEEEETEGKE